MVEAGFCFLVVGLLILVVSAIKVMGNMKNMFSGDTSFWKWVMSHFQKLIPMAVGSALALLGVILALVGAFGKGT